MFHPCLVVHFYPEVQHDLEIHLFLGNPSVLDHLVDLLFREGLKNTLINTIYLIQQHIYTPLVPGSPGPPGCPVFPGGPLDPGPPGLPRLPGGPRLPGVPGLP